MYNISMKTNRHHLYLGLALIVVSFVYWWLPKTHFFIGIANAVFYLGNIFFFDYLSERFGRYSLLKVKNRRKHFLLLGLLFGLLLEFYLNWVGRFWYYPYWDIYFYIFIFVPGFAAYTFYLLEVFLGVKAVLEHIFRKKYIRPSFAKLKGIFVLAGLLGSALLSLGTYKILEALSNFNNQEFWNIQIPRIGTPDNWYWYFAVWIGIWLVLELFEYLKHETSLLFETLKGNIWPLVALVLAGVGSAVLYEVFNLPGGLWQYHYANAPFSSVQILNFPVILYIAWPLHYLPAFSLYRLLYKKETEKLWQ